MCHCNCYLCFDCAKEIVIFVFVLLGGGAIEIVNCVNGATEVVIKLVIITDLGQRQKSA